MPRYTLTHQQVSQFPRLLLWLMVLIFMAGGVYERELWRGTDVIGYARSYQLSLSSNWRDWLLPQLFGANVPSIAPLYWWVSAGILKLNAFFSLGFDPHALLRLIVVIFFGLACRCIWLGTFNLMQNSAAQPYAFAFGGQGSPTQVATVFADASVLMILAAIGLAEPIHLTTPATLQLLSLSFCYFSMCTLASQAYQMDYPEAARGWFPWAVLKLTMAFLLVIFSCGLFLFIILSTILLLQPSQNVLLRKHVITGLLGSVIGFLLVYFGYFIALDRNFMTFWSIYLQHFETTTLSVTLQDWFFVFRNLPLFLWPIWPLAIFGLFCWREQRNQYFISIPFSFLVASLVFLVTSEPSNKGFFALTTPFVAIFAGLSLPYLPKAVRNWLDWCSVFLFSGLVVFIALVWMASIWSWPLWMAKNLLKQVPDFQGQVYFDSLAFALLAVFAWGGLIFWRFVKFPIAIWQTTLIPSFGAVLIWVVLSSLWMPLLNYNRNMADFSRRVKTLITNNSTDSIPTCLSFSGLDASEQAFLVVDGVQLGKDKMNCPYFLLASPTKSSFLQVSEYIDQRGYKLIWQGHSRRSKKVIYALFERPVVMNKPSQH